MQSLSTETHHWKVLLDAAAFVPTQPLDLAACPADFVTVSFYKMMGFPSGVGALLVRPAFGNVASAGLLMSPGSRFSCLPGAGHA